MTVYIKDGRKKTIGVGKIISDYYYDGSLSEPHFRKVKWLKIKDKEFRNNQFNVSTISDLNKKPDLIKVLEDYYFGNDQIKIGEETNLVKSYTLENFINETGYSKEIIQTWIRRIKEKKANCVSRSARNRQDFYCRKTLQVSCIRNKWLFRFSSISSEL